MKTSIIKNKLISLFSIILFIVIWSILSIIYSEIIIPSPIATFKAIGELVFSGEASKQLSVTTIRLISGFLPAVFISLILGICMGFNSYIKAFFLPLLNLIQTTPPITWLVLAIIWFGFNGNASIFIVFISTLPILLINFIEGVNNIDQKLLDMGKVFNLSKKDILFNIVIPSMMPYIISGITITLGNSWKVVAMGEVLSATTGIGSKITQARLNLETDIVFAWTSLLVFMGYITQNLLSKISYLTIRRNSKL